MLMMLGVGVGAACGAWLRWLFVVLFNPLIAHLPLGTLLANLLGGYLMGIAMGVFTIYVHLSPELRMMIVTGFLGGLTTFSSFSAEVMTMFLRQEIGWGLIIIFSHIIGSLGLTGLGLWTVMLMRGEG
jgi:CrcB protein